MKSEYGAYIIEKVCNHTSKKNIVGSHMELRTKVHMSVVPLYAWVGLAKSERNSHHRKLKENFQCETVGQTKKVG